MVVVLYKYNHGIRGASIKIQGAKLLSTLSTPVICANESALLQ